jgi:hypothetical protein
MICLSATSEAFFSELKTAGTVGRSLVQLLVVLAKRCACAALYGPKLPVTKAMALVGELLALFER